MPRPRDSFTVILQEFFSGLERMRLGQCLSKNMFLCLTAAAIFNQFYKDKTHIQVKIIKINTIELVTEAVKPTLLKSFIMKHQ